MGDHGAFAQLFHRYKDNVYTSLFLLTRSAPLAEEILQDVFLKIWLKRASLPGLEHFRAYFFTIVKHAAYKAVKDLSRQQALLQNGVEADTAGAAVQAEAERIIMEKEYAVLLDEALATLTEKQRAAYMLVRREGLKRDEAARVLGVSPETVKSNLDDAMRRMRAFLITRNIVLYLLIGIARMK